MTFAIELVLRKAPDRNHGVELGRDHIELLAPRLNCSTPKSLSTVAHSLPPGKVPTKSSPSFSTGSSDPYISWALAHSPHTLTGLVTTTSSLGTLVVATSLSAELAMPLPIAASTKPLSGLRTGLTKRQSTLRFRRVDVSIRHRLSGED